MSTILPWRRVSCPGCSLPAKNCTSLTLTAFPAGGGRLEHVALSAVLPGAPPRGKDARPLGRKHPRDAVGPQSLARDQSELPLKRARVLEGVDKEDDERPEDGLPEQVGVAGASLVSSVISRPSRSQTHTDMWQRDSRVIQ